jgi:hypothetical protein
MAPVDCIVVVEVMHIQTMTFMGDTEFMVDTNKIHGKDLWLMRECGLTLILSSIFTCFYE